MGYDYLSLEINQDINILNIHNKGEAHLMTADCLPSPGKLGEQTGSPPTVKPLVGLPDLPAASAVHIIHIIHKIFSTVNVNQEQKKNKALNKVELWETIN